MKQVFIGILSLLTFGTAIAQQLPLEPAQVETPEIYSCLNFQALFPTTSDPQSLLNLYESNPKKGLQKNFDKKVDNSELIEKKFTQKRTKYKAHFGTLLQSDELKIIKFDLNVSSSLSDNPYHFSKSKFNKKNTHDFIPIKFSSPLLFSSSQGNPSSNNQDVDEILINYDVYDSIVELKYTGFIQTVYTLNLESLKSEIEVRELLQSGEQLFFIHSSESRSSSNSLGVRWIF